MRSFLKMTWGTIAVAVLSVSALQADPFDNGDTCCTPRIEPCYGYAYNPGVFIADCCGWYANIAYLYWKPNQEGISAGTLNNLTESPAGVIESGVGAFDFIGTDDAKQVYPKFEWDSGFRIGIGYHLPCDSWSVGLEYTHYRTDSHTTYSSAFVDSSGRLIGSGISGSLFAPAYSAAYDSTDIFSQTQVAVDVDWRIQFNQLDLDFGREFYVARWMTLRPHVGLRALFINQSYNLQKNASGFNQATVGTAFTNSIGQTREAIKMNNDFKGVGLEGGLDMSFDLGCDLAFYGELAGGATFGRARVTQRANATNQFGVTSITTTEPINYRITDNYDTILCNADMAFGLRWRQRVNCDESLLTINFGYEEHIFFGYNRFRNIVGPRLQNVITNSPTGNLSFYGIVLSAAIDF